MIVCILCYNKVELSIGGCLMNKIKVVELFVGVGGFCLGLENMKNGIFDIIWVN